MSQAASRTGDFIGRVQDHLATHRPRTVEQPGLARAAVAVVLAPGPEATVPAPASLLMIRRAIRPQDPWSGQMAFPGGRSSPGDPDLLATAVRETREEVGISLDVDRCLGQLDDIAPRTRILPPIMVRPFVFTLPGMPEPRPAGHEVAEAGWFAIADLVGPGAYRAVTMEIMGARRVFPGYLVSGQVIWGMTERIITPLLRTLELIP